MIIYSPLPIETIFDGYDQMKLNYREVQFGNITMVIEQISDAEGRIVRVISPDPQDYLNPQYQPGKTFSFRPYFNN